MSRLPRTLEHPPTYFHLMPQGPPEFKTVHSSFCAPSKDRISRVQRNPTAHGFAWVAFFPVT